MPDTTTPLEAPNGRRSGNGHGGDGNGGRVSMRQVAEAAHVSVATVSMVLNDNPRISRATKMNVQRVVDRLGYRPNRLAQSLSSRYTRTIAILIPALRHALADAYFGELISGVIDRAGKLGHKVLLEYAKPDFVKQNQHVELFERRFVDGILCLGFNDKHHFLSDFADRQYPLVVVNNYLTSWDLDHVVCDYRSGADQAMSYLLQLGHRQIGMISGALEVRTQRDVLEVYEQRLHDAGADPDTSLREDGKFTEEGGAAAAEKLLQRRPDVTAIFAGNDKMAVGAIHYLNEAGIDVPGRVSVIGCDDITQSAFVHPSLTTIHTPLYEAGALACEKLIQRIRDKTDRVAELLPTHLVLRDSTGIVPQR